MVIMLYNVLKTVGDGSAASADDAIPQAASH
jgi:hypothetical protein